MQSALQPPPASSLPGSSATPSSAPPTEPIHDALAIDFPQFAGLTREELSSLLEDEEYFDALANTTPQAIDLQRVQEDRLATCINIAQRNDALRPELEALRTETARLFAEATELKQRFALLDEAQQHAVKRFTPSVQLSRLRAATSNQDHLSEQLIASFIEGGMSEEDFSRQFKEVRRVYHRRQACLDKWEKGSVVWRS